MSCHRPTFEEFARWAGSAPCVPVYRQLNGDGLTPVSAFVRIEQNRRRFFSRALSAARRWGVIASWGPSPSSGSRPEAMNVVVSVPGDPVADRASRLGRSVRRSSATCRPPSRGSSAWASPIRRWSRGLRGLRCRPIHRTPSPACRATIGVCPTSRSRSSTAWSSSITFARPSWLWPRRISGPASTPAGLTPRPAPGSTISSGGSPHLDPS